MGRRVVARHGSAYAKTEYQEKKQRIVISEFPLTNYSKVLCLKVGIGADGELLKNPEVEEISHPIRYSPMPRPSIR